VVCFGVGALTIFSSRNLAIGHESARSTSGVKSVRVPGIEKINGYRKWIRVNPTPLYLDYEIASLCSIASPEQVKVADKSNPHNRKFFTVYVNAVGQKAMMKSAKPLFPVGSIIVKEKLPAKNSKSPELLTVMIKRQREYDSAKGDWEYLVLNGTGTKIQGRGKIETCQSCHTFRKDTDYIFRTYLPHEISKKLR
jgi:hypothetical protein